MASELSNLIDQELKKMEEQPESQRLLRVKVGRGFAAPEPMPCALALAQARQTGECEATSTL
jgi:ribosomal protein L13E